MQWSVVDFQQVSNSGRIDAEYYRPQFLQAEKIAEKQLFKRLSELGNFIVGPFGSAFKTENYTTDSAYRYIRGKDVLPFWLNENDNVYLPEEDYERLINFGLVKGDLLISVVGTIGNISIVQNEVPAIFSCKSTVFRHEGIEPNFLSAYLNCEFGQLLLKRGERGAIQKGLNLEDLKIIPVYLPSLDFEKAIKNLIEQVKTRNQYSKRYLQQAETLLLTELGLANWQPKKQLSFITDYADVANANRFDADYFQPHYKELLEQISEQQVKFHKFDEAVQLRDKNYQPAPDKEYQYIELSNIGANGEITGFSKEFGDNLPSRARRIVRKGDVIISSIEGSIDSVALISDKENGALCSTGFYVAHSEIYNPETLLVLLKSVVGQLQLKRGCNGTILTAISKDELNRLKLPVINEATQEQLKQFVQQMYDDRAESKRLLETAKRAVEIAIEEDEAAAFRFNEMEAK